VKSALFADPAAVLARLEQAEAGVVFSSALETAIGARAALRLAFRWKGGKRALGFGVWPLFADARFDGPAAAPFIRSEDVERLNPEAVWNALGWASCCRRRAACSGPADAGFCVTRAGARRSART
jgi:O-succinylbenzoate synthase